MTTKFRGIASGTTPSTPVGKGVTATATKSTATTTSTRRHDSRPIKVILMGLRRCGKSSIQKVVFEKMPPADTLYLEPTSTIESSSLRSFLHFESSELPSSIPFMTPSPDDTTTPSHQKIFGDKGAAIWIIDSQDEYLSSIRELLAVAVFLAEHHPKIKLEVFIHKTDGLSEEYRYETFRECRQRVQDELSDYGAAHFSVAYHETSIFDNSVFDAVSKVVQKLVPSLPALETVMTRLCGSCGMQRAFLFDVLSKIYIASDASPAILKDYEVAADYVDVVADVRMIWGWRGRAEAEAKAEAKTASAAAAAGNRGDEERRRDRQVHESLVTYERNGEAYIYAREVNERLALVCLMGKGSPVHERALVDYNVALAHEALLKIFAL